MMTITKRKMSLILSMILLGCTNVNNEIRDEKDTETINDLTIQTDAINQEFLAKEIELRGWFGDWFGNLWNRICTVVVSDARGALKGYATSSHMKWTNGERGGYIVGYAVVCSFCSMFEEESQVDKSELMTIRSSVNANLGVSYGVDPSTIENIKRSEECEKPYREHLTNPLNEYGEIHNKAFFNFSKSYDANKKYTDDEILELLTEETIKACNLEGKNESDAIRKAIKENSSIGKDGNKDFDKEDKINELLTNDPTLTRAEAKMLVSFVTTIASIESETNTKDYANKFSETIEASDLSKEKKEKLLIYISTATHSKILWQATFSKESEQ